MADCAADEHGANPDRGSSPGQQPAGHVRGRKLGGGFGACEVHVFGQSVELDFGAVIITTTDLFVRRAFRVLSRPAPAAPPAWLQTSSTQGIPPAVQPVPSGPQPVSLDPKPADLETIGIQYRFQMQELRIGGHSSDEMRPATSASFVGGR